MSAPNEQARPAVVPLGSAGRIKADGRRIYRLVSPQIIWWTWVGVVVLGLGDLAVQGHNWISLKFGLGLLAVTGVIYALTLWPKVIADEDGMTVLNPFRRFRIPWGAVNGIFLADSVEVECARLAPKKDKTVYSWALASPRRARARAQQRGRRWDLGGRTRPSTYDRLPDAAKHVVKLTSAEVMARELGQLAEQARSRSGGAALSGLETGTGTSSGTVTAGPETGTITAGTQATAPQADSSGTDNYLPAGTGWPGGVMSARWAWQPLAAILVPGVAFAVAQIVK